MRFYRNCSRVKTRYFRRSASPGISLMRRTFRSEAQKAKGRSLLRGPARCYPNFEGLLRKQTTTSLGGVIQEPQAKPAFLSPPRFRPRCKSFLMPFRSSVAVALEGHRLILLGRLLFRYKEQ